MFTFIMERSTSRRLRSSMLVSLPYAVRMREEQEAAAVASATPQTNKPAKTKGEIMGSRNKRRHHLDAVHSPSAASTGPISVHRTLPLRRHRLRRRTAAIHTQGRAVKRAYSVRPR